MNIAESSVYQNALSLDRASYPLWKRAVKDQSAYILQNHPAAKQLRAFANTLREEALGSSYRFICKRTWTIDPMVEKFLNLRAVDQKAPAPQRITFLVQDLGGYGDLIFGVRALRTLKKQFPETEFAVVTNGRDKLKKVLNHAQLDCPIGTYRIKGFVTVIFDEIAHKAFASSDIVFVSPTGCGFLPPQITQEGRNITLLEYDRPDYGLDVAKRSYVTGVGPKALGIFLDPTVAPKSRQETLLKLDDQPLAQLLATLDPEYKHPLYFGYGHHDVEQFLSTMLEYEEGDAVILTSNFSREKVNFPPTKRVVLHEEAYRLDVFKAFTAQGVRCDFETAKSLRSELQERLENDDDDDYAQNIWRERIAAIDEILEANPNLKSEDQFEESLENGFCRIEGRWYKNTVLSEGSSGKCVHLVHFRGLSFDDTRAVKRCSDDITLSTGDQSFSEDVSLRKLIMYDRRKVQPILELSSIAKKLGLHLVAEYFDAFTENNISRTVACLKQRAQLRNEADELYDFVHKNRDLGPQLIGMVTRQMKGTLGVGRIHELFGSYVLDPREEILAAIACQMDKS